MTSGKRKPWPQKGTGRARQGSRRAPQFTKGYVVNGPRGPKSYYHLIPRPLRVDGLCTALTVKFHQNDLHIVDDLEIPNGDPEFLLDLMDTRFWGYSSLFVDDTDMMPINIARAVNASKGLSLMPVYGLNVYSILKHECLVITLRALDKIEQKLISEKHSSNPSFQDYTPLFDPPEMETFD
ncbi:hypothetical protein ACOME3_001515 [Neoechinorhynchus agilis]